MFVEVRLESSNIIAFKKTVGRERKEGYWTGKEILFSVKAPATSGKERGVSTQWRHFWPSGGDQSWRKVVFKYPC